MPVAEPVTVNKVSLGGEKEDLVTKLNQALAAENAPIRWQGPSLLNLGLLTLMQIFRSTKKA